MYKVNLTTCTYYIFLYNSNNFINISFYLKLNKNSNILNLVTNDLTLPDLLSPSTVTFLRYMENISENVYVVTYMLNNNSK